MILHGIIEVVKNLFLGNIVLDCSIPIVVNVLLKKAVLMIEEKLTTIYGNTIKNSLITLGLNTVGILFIALQPFGKIPSFCIASLFFNAALVFFIVRQTIFIKSNGKMILACTKSILQEKSISIGIQNFVYTQFPAIAKTYSGLKIACHIFPALDEIPEISLLVKYFQKIFWKRLAFFGGLFSIYTVLITYVIKPLLIQNFAGLTGLQILFYPITLLF